MNTIETPRYEKIKHCPVCESKDFVKWSEAKDLLTQSTDASFEYSLCKKCDSLFMSLRPVEEDVSFFYSSNYHPYQKEYSLNRSLGLLSKIKKIGRGFAIAARGKNNLNEKIKSFYSGMNISTTFVDFGCGAGKYLNLLKNSKCKTIGVDFSPIAVDAAKSNGHQGFLVDDFFKSIDDQSVDLVRMNHVVEHLYHPHDILKQLARKIRIDGRLHIAVPNPEGISSKIFRRYWHGLDCPRHVILYPSSTLVSVLESIGFYRFEVVQESISKDFIRSVGYYFSKYNFIRLSNVNTLMNSVFLKLLFALPIFIISKFGFGDRYHIFCYKKH